MTRAKVAAKFGVGESLLRQLERRGVLPKWGTLCPSGYDAALRLYIGSRAAGTPARRLTAAMRALVKPAKPKRELADG